MHKFLIRAASGIVYAAVIVLAILYGGWALWLLAIAFTIIGVCEFDNMAIGFSKKTLPVFIIDILGALSLLSLTVCGYAIILWIILEIVRFFAMRRCSKEHPDTGGLSTFGQLYLALPFACMLLNPVLPLVCMPLNPVTRLPLLIFIMLWLNDSGAYIVGSLTGRHKLCPSISPNKTWEGFIGGVAITLAGSWLMAEYCPDFFRLQYLDVAHWMILAVSTCIFGTIGDLVESKIKRIYEVKDSGDWIPGHGGILDRIDSFLIAFPVAFLLILLF